MRGKTAFRERAGCVHAVAWDNRMVIDGSSSSTFVCLAPTWSSNHLQRYVPGPSTLPLSSHSSQHPSLTATEQNVSLLLQRGVSRGAVLILHPWQGIASWWGPEPPDTHPLQHSVLESCRCTSKQQFYFFPCWMTWTLWTRWWPDQWTGVWPLPWLSVPPMRWEKVLARGERQSPFPSTAVFPSLLKLPIEPSQAPILVLGRWSTSSAKLEVAAPEDEDSLSHFCPYLWEGKTRVCLHYWKALCCLYIENPHIRNIKEEIRKLTR